MSGYNNLPTKVLAIDWETTGYTLPNYTDKHQGISFGALVINTQTLEQVDELYRVVRYDPKYEWSVGAEKVHGLTREYLDQHGVTQEQAAVDLAELCLTHFGGTDTVLLGHRVLFDKAFTEQLIDTIGLDLKIHPVLLDTAALGALTLGIWKSDELFELLGFDKRGKHNSLEDIKYTVEAVRKIKGLVLKGMELELR